MYTINGAYASFEEGIKGNLEPGKQADLVVVFGPILGVDPEEIRDMRAEMTLVGGERVHDKGVVSFR